MNELQSVENQQGNGVLPCVSGSALKGYWEICTKSYEIDGVEIPKGRMSYHTSTRPTINQDWRRATQEEIDTMQYHKGNAFNLRNV
jgi:hypothetical protein